MADHTLFHKYRFLHFYSNQGRFRMRNEFTAIVERDEEWFISYCPEIPGANGQGRTIQESLDSLAAAIALIMEDRTTKSPIGWQRRLAVAHLFLSGANIFALY